MADFLADASAYLVQGDKFWELTNVGSVNNIRYGKIEGGTETRVKSGVSQFLSQDDAVERAKRLVKSKADKGYAVIGQPVKTSKGIAKGLGTYLEKSTGSKTEYVRISLQDVSVEVVEGADGFENIVSSTKHLTEAEAKTSEKTIIRSYIGRGYRRTPNDASAEMPRKRPRVDDGPETIQELLDTIGLGRYVLSFETQRISVSDLLSLNEVDLTNIGIPATARKKILASIQNGSWKPYMMQDTDSEVEVVEDAKQSSFIVERGTKKPPKDISVMLAHPWDERDPTGWWMSEKLDGVRCYWNGKTLRSRNGNEYFAPDFFTKGFPKTVSLDGELWTGRKKFSECVSIVRKSDSKHDFTEWRKVIYVLFDAPSLSGKFETRLKYLDKLAQTIGSPYLRAHEHFRCQGREHLERELKRVEDLGGEGLMLREPGSNYDNFRSYALLKVKNFYDAEAVVIGYENGKGRNAGVMGALRVRGDNGVEFKVGSGFTDAERSRPPRIGSKITYKYQEVTKDGKPRFPTYLREHPGL